MLSTVFDSDEDINILAKRFIKKLDGCIKHNFKKVRVNKTKPTESEQLYNQLRELKGKEDEEGPSEGPSKGEEGEECEEGRPERR